MASTNKTTYYNLSQYIGSDKPTYLVDYNGDMSKIDTALHTISGVADGADTKATTNTSAIGTLASLTTESKTNLVGAINEVDSNTDTNTTNIATNTSNIGTLANLNTTAKNNLVSAINEVLGQFADFDLTSESLTVSVDVGTLAYPNINLATNNKKSIFKLYGTVSITGSQTGWHKITANTPLRPSSNYTINPCGIVQNTNGFYPVYVDVKTTGVIEIFVYKNTSDSVSVLLFPCIYFNSNFGDVS